MIVIFKHMERGAEGQHTLCKGPRCIGMPCFDPTEYTVSAQQKPFGNLFQDKAFNWNLDYWFCRGFWNSAVRHLSKEDNQDLSDNNEICPETFAMFSTGTMTQRIDDGWMFRIL